MVAIMAKKANPMAVKSALTYEISEAAAALGKNPATIRNWIKDGLPVMASQKPYLISGEAIREYLRAKYKDAKTPLAPSELYCPACKAGREPVDGLVTFHRQTSKMALLKGECMRCSATAARFISMSRHAEFTQTFKISKGGESDAY
jgi:hypothetical protein